MSESKTIGVGRCPCCASTKARYTVSKSQLAVVTCNSCNFQGFSRSDRSDDELRKNIIAPAAEPTAPAITKPEEPAPAPAKKSAGWGMMRGREIA